MAEPFIEQIKKALPESSWPRVIRALRHDLLIWAYLENNIFAQKAIDYAQDDPDKWTPASLAFLDLGAAQILPRIKQDPQQAPPEEIRHQAASLLESFTNQTQPERDITLANIGLLAVAQREQWRISGSWDGLIEQINETPEIPWHPVAACLYGMVPEPETLIAALISPKRSSQRHKLGLHALLSNPLQIELMAKTIMACLQTFSSLKKLEFIRYTHGLYPQLAKYLAEEILDALEDLTPNSANPIKYIQSLLERTELFKISGRHAQAIPLLENMWEQTMRIQADMTTQLAQAAAEDQDHKTVKLALDQAEKLNYKSPDFLSKIALAKLTAGDTDLEEINIESIQDLEPESVFSSMIAGATLAAQFGQLQKAHTYADQALQSAINDDTSSPTTENLLFLTEIFLKLAVPLKAQRAGELALSQSPNNPKALSLLSQSQIAAGDLTGGMLTAHTAVSLDPENLTLRRHLANTLVANQKCAEALDELDLIVERQAAPDTNDLLSLASCALKINVPHKAARACQQILHREPGNGLAHTLYGQAMLETGDQKTAIEHFTQAATLTPQNPEAWLLLADLYLEKGEIKKAKEQLIAAAQTAGDCPDIHLALGEIYQNEDLPTKALAEFQKAAQTLKENPADNLTLINKVQFNLGACYYQLGYLEEALQILGEAHQANPTQPKIAHAYAKALIDQHKPGEALSALTIAMQTEPVDPEVYLDYAQIHLNLGAHPEEAERVLQTILESDPFNIKAVVLQAETYAMLGDYVNALNAFQFALESDLTNHSEWYSRIIAGLADTAIVLNQVEVAIRVLEDALRKDGSNFELLKTLCNAYIGGGKSQDALNTLLAIRSLGDNNPEILLWVSEKASSIGEDQLSLEVLQKAARIAPNNVDILVNLGYTQITHDQQDAARKTFQKLFDSKKANSGSLRLAAQAFIGLGEINDSIPFLERALEISSEEETFTLLSDMAAAHTQAGNLDTALAVIEKQIIIEPYNPDLHTTKAELLIKLDRPKAALVAVLDAVSLTPTEPSLHHKAAELLMESGDITAALDHALKALELSPENINIRYLAADLNLACLNLERANTILTETHPPSEGFDLRFALLMAEVNIAKEQPSQAQVYLKQHKDANREHPRLLAAEARILAAQKEDQAAQNAFKKGLAKLGALDLSAHPPQENMQMQLALAHTARDFNFWDVALYLGTEAAKSRPFDPRPHFFLAQAYVERAEFQRLCETVDAKRHAPGDEALSNEAQKLFKHAVQTVQRLAGIDPEHPVLKKLALRSRYALQNLPPTDHPEDLLQTPQDHAALMAAYRRAGLKEQALQIGKEHPKHPLIYLQTALVLSDEQPHEALGFAYSAAERDPSNPINLAQLAALSQRAGDLPVALECINRALTIWVDEPRWHALAASIHNQLGAPSLAIIHLEQACQLEPDHVDHFLKLGQTHLDDDDTPKAIRILEHAAHLSPGEVNIWETLVLAHQSAQDYKQALFCAGQMLKRMPKNTKPLLLHARIHIDAESPQAALPYINQALSINPQDPKTLELQAQTLTRLGQPEQALAVIDLAIQYAPNSLPYLITRAGLIGMVEGSQAKLNTLEALAKEFPQVPEALSALASALIEAGHIEEAMRTTQQAIKIGEGHLTHPELAELHLQLGQLLRAAGQLDQAIHHLNQSAKLFPGKADAYLELGLAYTDRRDHQLALDHFRQGITVSPNDARSYYQVGILLKECKDYTGAEEMLRRASSLSPKNIDFQRQLAAVVALALVHKPVHFEVDA